MPVEPDAPVSGNVEPRFAAVLRAFRENFTDRGEIGAAVCIVVDGLVVADLWGGWRDVGRRLPWERDTLVNVFSVGKAVAALCVAQLVGRGLLQFDQPVAKVWPEFAAAGKAGVTLRQLLSHQAGLPALRAVLPPGSVFDWKAMCDALAAEEPWWDPGTAHGYHVNTFGFLAGEVVRRATGESLGTVVRREITGPLDADFFIGVPRPQLHRIADFIGLHAAPSGDGEGLTENQLMERHAYFNPPEFSGAGVINTTRWRTAELPSTNGHASACGIARIFASLGARGRGDADMVVEPAALAEATSEQVYGNDEILHRPSRFGIGFQLTQSERMLGPNPRSFGHFGAGGSLGFCDPDARVAFGYAINTMGPRWQNPRNRALIDACYGCL
ncbi:MAG TPA: serine hydrolase domain-containing protein [Acidimicrobiales bacterium]|nr:serine hydrolase domain-containing protein [Acidimicrobiales bacterium]